MLFNRRLVGIKALQLDDFRGIRCAPNDVNWDDTSIHEVDSNTEYSPVEKEKGPPSILSFPSVKVEEGRPDLTTIMREEVEVATGRMAISGEWLP